MDDSADVLEFCDVSDLWTGVSGDVRVEVVGTLESAFVEISLTGSTHAPSLSTLTILWYIHPLR